MSDYQKLQDDIKVIQAKRAERVKREAAEGLRHFSDLNFWKETPR